VPRGHYRALVAEFMKAHAATERKEASPSSIIGFSSEAFSCGGTRRLWREVSSDVGGAQCIELSEICKVWDVDGRHGGGACGTASGTVRGTGTAVPKEQARVVRIEDVGKGADAPGAIRAAKALGGRAEASDAASGKENEPPDNTIPL